MKRFSAVVKDRQTKETIFIENQEYSNKANFIKDLKHNGYMVNPDKVKESEVFDYIMENTNCEPQEWKYINRVPQEGEYIGDWIHEGLNKSHENLMKRIDKRAEELKISHQQTLEDANMTEEQFQEWLKNNRK